MNKTIFNLFAALAFIFAALATPSASAYKAFIAAPFSAATAPVFEGTGNTRDLAIQDAIAECADDTNDLVRTRVCENENLQIFWVSSSGVNSGGNDSSCITFALDRTVNAPQVFAGYGNADEEADARNEAMTSCNTASGTGCLIVARINREGDDINLGAGTNFICDTTGLICGDDEIPNQTDGSCGECPTATHEVVDIGGTDTCVEICGDNQVRNADLSCQTCESHELANKPTQMCDACPTETTHVLVDIEGTETCRAREICESSELVDSELGICEVCPTNSVVSEDQSTCVCNANVLDNYESEGMCEVCPDGYTANAAQDDCICSDNSLVTASGHCEPCTADNPLADKENNRCIRATEQTTCQTYFLDTTPILNEFGECVAVGTTADCSLVYPASAPLYNETTKQCEAPDCPAARPVYDEGNCRATIPEDCANGEIFQNSNCVARGDDDKVNNRAIVIGLIMVGAFVADSWSDERDSELNWTPSYAFNTNNGNVSYSVGSRWTAKTENFGYYWQTAKSGSGDIRYSSGIGYNNGIMQANIDSEGTREDTDIDLSISAQKTWGLWNIGGGYRIDTRLTPTESKTRNRLNLTAKYKIDQWILSATANTTGKKSTARINYSYRF